MEKLDFIKQDKKLYAPKTDPELINVPKMNYLMYDGQGVPDGNPDFQHAMGALYGVAYGLKFLSKKGHTPEWFVDFKVPPPEGLWWMADNGAFDTAKPEQWRWTLMLRMPDFVTPHLVREIAEELVAKKKDPAYLRVRLECLDEGPAVQVMHIGSYDTEQGSIDKIHGLVHALGYRPAGRHHEIYFGDPRRTAPDKLKTVLRQPITA
jgi:hypothetical protein